MVEEGTSSIRAIWVLPENLSRSLSSLEAGSRRDACKEEKGPLGGAAHSQCGIPRPRRGDSSCSQSALRSGEQGASCPTPSSCRFMKKTSLQVHGTAMDFRAITS